MKKDTRNSQNLCMFARPPHSLKITEETPFRNPISLWNPQTFISKLKLLCMKKIYSLLENDKVQAGLIIGSIFLVTGLVTILTMYV